MQEGAVTAVTLSKVQRTVSPARIVCKSCFFCFRVGGSVCPPHTALSYTGLFSRMTQEIKGIMECIMLRCLTPVVGNTEGQRLVTCLSLKCCLNCAWNLGLKGGERCVRA